jgi:hypothetical protein
MVLLVVSSRRQSPCRHPDRAFWLLAEEDGAHAATYAARMSARKLQHALRIDPLTGKEWGLMVAVDQVASHRPSHRAHARVPAPWRNPDNMHVHA